MATKIALMGAGGKMGCRITDKMRSRSDYEMRYVEVSEGGLANLRARNLSPTPENQAVEVADAVVLALPDILIGAVTQKLIPKLRAGTMVIGLDPAAAYAGVMPIRKDLTYFVSHPCHPPLFNDETTEEARTDWFGGVIAKQHIVCALHSGPEEDYAKGEAIARAMYAPVMNANRITVEQMAILEPALVESMSTTAIVAIKEAMDAAVAMGVPEDAAMAFLMGHVRIQFAIVFGLAGFPFSDGAKLATQQAYDKILQPGWRERIMNLDAIKKSVDQITRRKPEDH